MRKYVAWSLVTVLMISLAAPAGAVFALEEGLADTDAVVSPMLQEEPRDTSSSTVDSQELPEQPVSAGELESRDADDTFVEDVETIGLPEDIADVPPEQTVPIQPEDKTLVISYVQSSGAFGKYIEIRNVSAVDYQTRALSLLYVRSSGSNSSSPDVLATFYGTIKAGGRVTIGNVTVADSESQSADVYFTQTTSTVMDAAGGWLLLVDDITEHDSFCWSTGSSLCGDDRYAPKNINGNTVYSRCFDAVGATTLCSFDEETGTGALFESKQMLTAHDRGGFVPFYNSCSGLVVSEVAPQLTDQFIEIHNPTEAEVSLEMCVLQVQTRVYQFGVGDTINAGAYLAINPGAVGTSLARTTAGEVRLLSSAGELIDGMKYSTPREDRSAIRDGEGSVVWTLSPTPGKSNKYVPYLPCEAGYWRNEETGRCNKEAEAIVSTDCGEGRERNPATGRCRNIPGPRELTPCRDGQYRSEETNRCRSIATVAASVLKPCADDQFRNPLTNRCKAIASTDDISLADCGEGRERNPETNRCRNILSAAMPVVPFAPDKVTQTAQGTLGWWALGGVSLVALGYAGWQWRFEVGRLVRRMGQVFTSSTKE